MASWSLNVGFMSASRTTSSPAHTTSSQLFPQTLKHLVAFMPPPPALKLTELSIQGFSEEKKIFIAFVALSV